MTSHQQPVGQVPVPLFIFSAVSLLLGFMTELLGVFEGMNESLRASWEARGVVFSVISGLPEGIGVFVVALAVGGVSASILSTSGSGRRIILAVSALVLSAAFLPVFAAWGIFWKPFGMILAVFWSILSSFLYVRTHRMPCEMILSKEAQNVISLSGAPAHEARSAHADG